MFSEEKETVDLVIKLLNDIKVQRETMGHILHKLNLEDEMLKHLLLNMPLKKIDNYRAYRNLKDARQKMLAYSIMMKNK